MRSFIRANPGNWVAKGREVVYYARAAHAFSAGIKCGHCNFGTKKNNFEISGVVDCVLINTSPTIFQNRLPLRLL